MAKKFNLVIIPAGITSGSHIIVNEPLKTTKRKNTIINYVAELKKKKKNPSIHRMNLKTKASVLKLYIYICTLEVWD